MSVDTHWDINIRTLTDAGVKLPDEYREIQRRMTIVLDGPKQYRAKLVAAIGNPGSDVSDEELSELRAMAIAEADNGYGIADEVTRAGYAKLKEIYAGIADDVWSKLAAEFNTIAVQFADAVNTVDPSLGMADVFTMSKKAQEAWTNGNSLAHELSALVPALHTAAQLAGSPVGSRSGLLRYLVDHEGFYGEDVVPLGFDWLALIKLGLPIRAVTNLEDAKPWTEREPEPAPAKPVYVDPFTRDLMDGWDYLGTEANPLA
ncbi:hypothetical protein [Nocardia sp. bgisy118]|uniref:hypothetical protein n=1 Tax=Nocardia sp. bgisy118 TaxID=3413786 RepID=UPI003F4A828E